MVYLKKAQAVRLDNPLRSWSILLLATLSTPIMGQNEVSDLSDHVIRVAVLLPNSSYYLGSIPRVGPAISLAVHAVEIREMISGYRWEILYYDTHCIPAYGLLYAFRIFIEQRVHVILGPVCDYVIAPIARLLKFFDIPMLTAGGLASDYGLKKSEFDTEYYLLTRTGLSFDGLASFVVNILQQFNWQNVLIMYEALARSKVAKEDYCVLWTKALLSELRPLEDFTVRHYKLQSYMTLTTASEVLREETGTRHG
ncbi:atrial natriuretic peptide receptor 3-like, partial [Limulus polyphemus]|uniref:Atrial natriuretic peptide receptor 3-like n=1 Tax=Limulus polyphemus TaxID=6850 RepID=A0ABM1C2C5_LIMPO